MHGDRPDDSLGHRRASLALLGHARGILINKLGDMSEDILNWRFAANATNIADHCIHIALVELSLLAGLSTTSREGDDIWRRLVACYRPERMFQRTCRLRLSEVLGALTDVRDFTLDRLGEHPGLAWADISTWDFGRPCNELAAQESLDERQMGALRSQIDATVGPVLAQKQLDLVGVLLNHEAYHRGQVLLMKYLHSTVQEPVRDRGTMIQ